MEHRVLVTVLSGVGARIDGETVDLGGPRQRRLLAALAVEPHVEVSADLLIDRVWTNGDLPDDPRRTLRTYLTRLRRSLAPTEAVLTGSDGWRLDLDVVSIDSLLLTSLVDRSADPALDAHQRLAAIDEALALYSGSPFGDLADEPWLRAETERLQELRVALIERRYQAMLDAGKHTDAIPGLVAEAEAHPLRDRLVGLQMLALFRTGRQAEASRVFQDHRRRLADELGLEPGSDLADLDRKILADDASLRFSGPSGRALRGYRIGEQLGEGAFAMVYRGTQPSLGRDVAVKIIRSELANRPEFIRRFETEAHVVARLEHPRVVPLYDYWREPDRACLVFRYLRGGTLEARLTRSGALDIEEAARLVDHISAALGASHAAGVVHRDVKPANVFLDEEGNYYLGDFGIALEAAELSDPTAALSAGSPAYAAPEQLRREPISPTADVHSLAITTYEALTVRLPFPDAASHADLLHRQLNDPIPSVQTYRSEIPAAVDEVLAKATAKDPAVRYPSVEMFAAEFLAAVAPDAPAGSAVGPLRPGTVTSLSAGGERNPFKGLRAFTEADAGDFRGRERLVDRLIELFGRPDTTGRIAAVVGPSGIGKSSIVRAGLLPALRRGAVPGSDQWFVATMLPGREPFEELGSALLRVATRVPGNMMDLLHQDHRGLARVVKALVDEDSEAEVLLVVDQFEELFTLVDDETQRELFLEAIEYAVTDSRCPLRLVLTMRADFWDRPLRHGSFARLIERSVVNVTALAPDELERAITEPALATGCEFEPGLVSEIAADVADQPGALPLLQYALTELWERRISGLLTRDAYRELGGVTGALARRAEELHGEASAAEQNALRRLFGRLVSLGEGTEDTRRRALRSELVLSAGADELIDRFGRARLLSFDRDPATREPTVEVAHEALLRQWPRLRGWLEEDRDGLRLHRHLGTAAGEWDRDGRPAAELYRGGRLEAAEGYATDHADDLTPVESDFVAAGVALRLEEESAAQERLDLQVRNNRRLRGLLSGVGALLVLALIAGGLAFQQRGRANDNASAAEANAAEAALQADTAEANAAEAALQAGLAAENEATAEVERIAALAAAAAGDDVPLSLLLAVEVARRAPGPLGLGALQTVLSQSGPFLGLVPVTGASSVRWLNDATLLVAGSGGVQQVSWETGEIEQLSDATPYVRFHALGDGNTRLYTMFDANEGFYAFARADDPAAVEVRTIRGELIRTIDHNSPVDALRLTNRGELLTIDLDGFLQVIEVASGAERWRVDAHPEGDGLDVVWPPGATSVIGLERSDFGPYRRDQRPQSIEVVDTDELVVTVEHETIRRWRLSTGELVGEHITAPVAETGRRVVTPIGDLTLSPDGQRYGGAVRHLLQFGPLDGSTSGVVDDVETTTAFYGNPKIDGIEWLEDDEVLALLSDGRLAWINPADGSVRQFQSTGLTAPTGFRLSPTGERVAIMANEGLSIWSLNGDGLLTDGVPRQGVHHGDVLPGEILATNYALFPNDGWKPPNFVDISSDTPRPLQTPTNNGTVDVGLGFPFSDRYFGGQTAVTSQPSIYDAESGELLVVLEAPGSWSGQDFFDAENLAAFGTGEGVGIYQLATAAATHVIEEPGPYAPSISFHPDGTALAVAGLDGQAHLFEVGSWEKITPRPLAEVHGVRAVRFHPDGQSLITVQDNGELVIRDTTDYAVASRLVGADRALVADSSSFYFDETGRYLITSGDGSARLWDLEAGVAVGTPFPNDPDFRIGSGSGFRLVTGVGDHIKIWELDFDRWPEIACQAAGRNLTAAEWDQFMPSSEPYRQTCIQWPTQVVTGRPEVSHVSPVQSVEDILKYG